MVTRACCCGGPGQPCDCAPGSVPVVPLSSYGDFTYTVNFPGSSGPPHVKQRFSSTETRIVDSIPGVTGEMLCADASGSACGTSPSVPIPDSIIYDEQVEIETRECGFPFANNVALNFAYIWQKIPNTCVPSPCTSGGDWRAVGWANGGLPRSIIAVQTPPRFLLGAIYPGAGTIRFRRLSASRFDCDITSAPPLPGGVQSISASECRYFHRSGTTAVCNGTGGSGLTCRFGAGLYNYYGDGTQPTVRCEPNGCCCQSELQIRFTVRQYYDILGYTSASWDSYGPVSGGYIDMGVRAFYYGCIDGRLYDVNSSQDSTRTFQLDRALVAWPQNYLGLDRYGIGFVPIQPVPSPLNFAYSYVDANDGCQFCSSSTLTSANAIALGIPATVEMVRQSP